MSDHFYLPREVPAVTPPQTVRVRHCACVASGAAGCGSIKAGTYARCPCRCHEVKS